MKVFIEPGASGDVLATIAIGDEYLSTWEENAFPGWREYCLRHGLGLIVFNEDLIARDQKVWKKATWQKMLIGEALRSLPFSINNVCYLDTDILVNYIAPNIFEGYDPETIGLVSLRHNLPFPYKEVLRRMAFMRHNYYDELYPLDSALFMSLEHLYEYHELPIQSDEACMGLIVFNVQNHTDIMRNWFDKYDRTVRSVTNGGDQTHINYEIQNWGRITWLDYRYQAIWPFEMAWKYPFLYKPPGCNNVELVRECIEASLFANYFLHFAGSWHESGMWKIGGFFEGSKEKHELEAYRDYLATPVTGVPKGMIKP